MRGEIEGKRFSGIAVLCTAILFFCFSGMMPLNAGNAASNGADDRRKAIGTREIPEAVARIAEQIAEETGSEAAEECLEYYWELLERPLDINSASEASLRRLSLLSEFQIRSLKDYISEFGAILSDSELALVSGFNAELVALIRPFITFGSSSAGNPGQAGDGIRQDAMLRADRKFSSSGSSGSTEFNASHSESSGATASKGLPVALTAKYHIQFNSRWEAGLSARESAYDTLRGGFLPTFTSAHAAVRNLPIFTGTFLRNVHTEMLVIGDFTARFGQGLTIWKAFPVTFVSQPASLCKSESGIMPYTSASGTNFLRGIGGTLSLDGWSFSAFGSSVGPRTMIGYPRKKASHNIVGVNISKSFRRFKAGATLVSGGRDTINAGIDFYVSPGRGWRIFGEAAASLSPHSISSLATASTPKSAISHFAFAPAALLGFVWSPVYEFEASAMIRSYSAAFIAPDAGAYSTLSKCSNQQGLTASAKWLRGPWSTTGYIDAVYHPAPRYGIKTSSSVIKSHIDASRTIALPQIRHSLKSINPRTGRTSYEAVAHTRNFSESTNNQDSASYDNSHKTSTSRNLDQSIIVSLRASYTYKAPSAEHRAGLRIEFEYSVGKFLALDTRLEGCIYKDANSISATSLSTSAQMRSKGVEFGALAYQDCYLKLLDDKLIIRAQIVSYKTASWNSRIYCYEYDLPQTFSIPAFYGSGSGTGKGSIGLSGSGVVSYRTRFGFTFWLKASQKLCRFGVTMRL